MTEERGKSPEEQLEELWSLVDQLGDLSMQLRRAARGALVALGVPPVEGEDRQ